MTPTARPPSRTARALPARLSAASRSAAVRTSWCRCSVNGAEENDGALGDNALVNTPEETVAICQALEAAGADALELRLGTFAFHEAQFVNDGVFAGYGYDGATSFGTFYDFDSHFSGLLDGSHSGCGLIMGACRYVKQHVSIPVGGVVFMDPALAPDYFENALSEGWLDMIYMHRPVANCDAEYANKLREGRIDEIRPCCRCLNCLGGLCRVNPCNNSVFTDAMPEGYEVRPADGDKNVMVIGGGPAGMEAARVAAERGYAVTLYEKNGLGGLLDFAEMVKGKHEKPGPSAPTTSPVCWKWKVWTSSPARKWRTRPSSTRAEPRCGYRRHRRRTAGSWRLRARPPRRSLASPTFWPARSASAWRCSGCRRSALHRHGPLPHRPGQEGDGDRAGARRGLRHRSGHDAERLLAEPAFFAAGGRLMPECTLEERGRRRDRRREQLRHGRRPCLRLRGGRLHHEPQHGSGRRAVRRVRRARDWRRRRAAGASRTPSPRATSPPATAKAPKAYHCAQGASAPRPPKREGRPRSRPSPCLFYATLVSGVFRQGKFLRKRRTLLPRPSVLSVKGLLWKVATGRQASGRAVAAFSTDEKETRGQPPVPTDRRRLRRHGVPHRAQSDATGARCRGRGAGGVS